MKVIRTAIPEILVLKPELFKDQRGFVFEFFQAQRYAELGVSRREFTQDNLCRSGSNVIRGLHLQNPAAQGRIVSVLCGRILDVVVDVRVGSPYFGRHVTTELSDENRQLVWIPRGFAHGFAVLSDSADVFYKCDHVYSPKDEIVVRWNDPAIGIAWKIENPLLSSRDANAPLLREIKNLPIYGRD
jgi:dTDP-4-dehydrorhamnose 3,5-epimerase